MAFYVFHSGDGREKGEQLVDQNKQVPFGVETTRNRAQGVRSKVFDLLNETRIVAISV